MRLDLGKDGKTIVGKLKKNSKSRYSIPYSDTDRIKVNLKEEDRVYSLIPRNIENQDLYDVIGDSELSTDQLDQLKAIENKEWLEYIKINIDRFDYYQKARFYRDLQAFIHKKQQKMQDVMAHAIYLNFKMFNK